mgnify:CR=1 FL=1
MPKKNIPGFADVRATRKQVDALSGQLETAKAALKEASEAAVQRIRRGETSGDVIEDALLVETRLDDQRVKRFLDLALDRAFVGEQEVLGDLLGNGRSAHRALGARQRARRRSPASRAAVPPGSPRR